MGRNTIVLGALALAVAAGTVFPGTARSHPVGDDDTYYPDPPRRFAEPPPPRYVEPPPREPDPIPVHVVPVYTEPLVLRRPSLQTSKIPTFLLTLRAGGLRRTGHGGGLEQAASQGYDLGGAVGGGIDFGVETFPRFSLHVSYNPFKSNDSYHGSSYTVMTQAIVGQARYAVGRWYAMGGRVMTQFQLGLGGGLYLLQADRDLAARVSTARGGLRTGVDFSIYYGVIGVVAGYAFHYAPALGERNTGPTLEAGGHEISAGLTLRF